MELSEGIWMKFMDTPRVVLAFKPKDDENRVNTA